MNLKVTDLTKLKLSSSVIRFFCDHCKEAGQGHINLYGNKERVACPRCKTEWEKNVKRS